jgi:GDP-mannose 6-dehydrogenase
MKISVFGMGYVGIVTSACLAKLGHSIIGVDADSLKVEMISQGKSPIYEKKLNELLVEALKNNLLSATQDFDFAIKNSDVSIICVGTPSEENGSVNTKYLENVMIQISSSIKKYNPNSFLVINRSTCDINAHMKCVEILNRKSGMKVGLGLNYCCHPEFLREGEAINDFFNPPKIVFGVTDISSKNVLSNLYTGIDAPTFFTTIDTASFVKYADNVFHAIKVTFANEIGLLSKQFNVNSHEIMEIFCADTKLNISTKYLKPGGPFGGSCLPKDIRSILSVAEQVGVELKLIKGAITSNNYQVELISEKLKKSQQTNIGFIGVAFKESTDDIRESPIVKIISNFSNTKINVYIFDEHLSENELALSYLFSLVDIQVNIIKSLQDIISKSDLLVVSHKLDPERWNCIKFQPSIYILDLVGVDAIKHLNKYEGLYW